MPQRGGVGVAKGWGEGGSTRGWRKLRAYVLKRDGGRCRLQLEGCMVLARHVHHLIPGWQGRPEDADLRALGNAVVPQVAEHVGRLNRAAVAGHPAEEVEA